MLSNKFVYEYCWARKRVQTGKRTILLNILIKNTLPFFLFSSSLTFHISVVYNDSNAIKSINNNSLPFTITQKTTLLPLIYHLENDRKERERWLVWSYIFRCKLSNIRVLINEIWFNWNKHVKREFDYNCEVLNKYYVKIYIYILFYRLLFLMLHWMNVNFMNFAWKVKHNKISFARLVLNRCNLNWKTLSSFQTVSRDSTGVQNKYVCTCSWEAYRQSSTFHRYMEVDLTHLRLKGQTTNKILTIPFMQLPTFEFFVKKKKKFSYRYLKYANHLLI